VWVGGTRQYLAINRVNCLNCFFARMRITDAGCVMKNAQVRGHFETYAFASNGQQERGGCA
jgi:hypothetical protein